MFDPMKWFGRAPYQQVEEDIEVDQISFTSSCSSGEHGEQTPMTDLISFEDTDLNVPGTSDASVVSADSQTSVACLPLWPEPQTTMTPHLNESSIVRNSIFWFTESEVDASKLVLPISNRGRVCRFENDVDDNQLETMCRTLQISSALCERNRWLNRLARDPVTARLVAQLDEEFATESSDALSEEEVESRPPTTSVSSSCVGAFLEGAAPVEIAEGMTRTTVPERRGIASVSFVRKINQPPSSVCSAIISKAVEMDKPIDRRMVEWMRGFVEVDTWIREVAPASRNHDKYSFEVPSLPEDWLMSVHKQPPIRQGLEAQQWKCAACRQSLHPPNDTSPRFCDFYGLFFCALCHGGEKSIIPARVIQQWSFSEHSVCDRAVRFLSAVRESPVFRIRELCAELIKKNKSLRAVLDLRQKLRHMETFIKVCVDASVQSFEFGNLSTMFASLDRYLLETDDLFSLNDLLRVYNKDLPSLLEPLAKRGREHILHCKRCRLQAPVCVRCNDMTDRLFPFEDRAVTKCDGCGHFSHSPKCPRRDVPRDTHCPKCARIKSRVNSRRVI